MWDGRETFPGQTMAFNLMDQANAATLGHAQASAPLTTEQRQKILAFETALYTAQIYDVAAGELGAKRAPGGRRLSPNRISSSGSTIPRTQSQGNSLQPGDLHRLRGLGGIRR